MPRRLLNIASIVCLVACVALMGMWVRSYSFEDEIRGRFAVKWWYEITSAKGELRWQNYWLRVVNEYVFDWPWWKFRSGPFEEAIIPKPSGVLNSLGIDAQRTRLGWQLILPYWFLALTTGSLAMLFQLRWPPRFTLRSLFIATTFFAVVLGMVAWLDRAWIGK